MSCSSILRAVYDTQNTFIMSGNSLPHSQPHSQCAFSERVISYFAASSGSISHTPSSLKAFFCHFSPFHPKSPIMETTETHPTLSHVSSTMYGESPEPGNRSPSSPELALEPSSSRSHSEHSDHVIADSAPSILCSTSRLTEGKPNVSSMPELVEEPGKRGHSEPQPATAMPEVNAQEGSASRTDGIPHADVAKEQ